jgi:hypothetical protein
MNMRQNVLIRQSSLIKPNLEFWVFLMNLHLELFDLFLRPNHWQLRILQSRLHRTLQPAALDSFLNLNLVFRSQLCILGGQSSSDRRVNGCLLSVRSGAAGADSCALAVAASTAFSISSRRFA